MQLRGAGGRCACAPKGPLTLNSALFASSLRSPHRIVSSFSAVSTSPTLSLGLASYPP